MKIEKRTGSVGRAIGALVVALIACGEYAEMASALAEATRRTAKALEDENSKLAADAAHEMASFGPREKKLMRAINAYCNAR